MQPDLPSGTVTFLFSDIEGSTERWDRHRTAMQDAVRRHDALVRAEIEAHGGYVFKTIGDAFCAVFRTAPEAVAAAYAAEKAMLGANWDAIDGLKVRIAIHTGEADERDGDYFGAAVNRTARLLAIGHGGQVLVSGIAADLVQGALPAQVTLRDLGQHRLRDLTRPEWVYQLIAPDLPADFPSLRSLDALPNNLPRQLTSFVGREADVAEIRELAAKTQLLSIVGTGGVGKTRTALQVGADMLDGSGDGVWFVELAPLDDPSLVPAAIAATLGLQEAPPRPLLETIVAYLKTKRLLLILDNCEHVVAAAASAAATILRGCPNVTILATSREGLGIAGETIHRMPSLASPSPREQLSVEEALQYGAIALFDARARASDTRFRLTGENAPVVAEVCRRLDGIPLAIELAAARVKVLSVKALAEKLDERFRLLTGGDRTALPRQQTMRALVDWSYDLLSNNERALFRRLSIFAGGFKLETAVAVCADDVVADFEVLDLLSSLVDKSLVHAELAGDDTRYRLLESTRQYAREKLVERGERDPVAARHATAFMNLAERLNAEWATTPDRTWIAEVEPELDNWRAALNWTLVERGDVLVGQRLTGNLFWVWHATAPAEGRRWVKNALELADDATPLATLAELQIADTQLHMSLSLWGTAVAAAETALATCERLGQPFPLARAQRQFGAALTFTGRHEDGEIVLRRALETFRELGVRREVGITLRLLGASRDFAGDFESSRSLHAESLTVFKALGADRQIAMTANNLAEVEFHAGNVEAAIRLISESLVQNRAGGAPRALATDLANSAAYLWFVGRFDEARAQARECLSLARLHQLETTVAFVLQHLAAIALGVVAGEDEERRRETALRAAQLLGFVEERIAQLEAAREYTEEVELGGMLGEMRALLGPEALEAAQQRGRSLTEDQAVAEALAL